MEQFLKYIGALSADEDIPRWSGFMPEKRLSGLGDTLRFYDLHPVLRALLIADGTVTMAIEAIYREPVEVSAKRQEFVSLDAPVPLLDVVSGEPVFVREVTLDGASSHKRYVRAFSLLKQSAIDEVLWAQLKSEEIGMGVVLRSAARNSFRQVLHIGAGDLEGRAGFVHRTYSVHIDSQPAILITEVFELAAFSTGYR